MQGGSAILDEIDTFTNEGTYSTVAVGREETDLLPDERRYLAETDTILITENDQGFVTMDYFDNPQQATSAWSDVHVDMCICFSCGTQLDEDERYCSPCDQRI